MQKTLKNHPIILFYLLAFGLAWCIKIPVVLSNTDNILLRLLPSFFPAMAALVTVAVLAGRRGIKDLLGQIGRLRVAPVWYLIALTGPLALNLLAVVLAIPFGEAFPGFVFPGIRVLPVVVAATIFALGEELGWRGFALPRLQSRYNALVASLIVGLLWWAWHLPEALAGPATGVSLQQIVSLELRDLILNVAASIMMTWIYNRTGRSVLLVALFHVSIGLLGEFLAIPVTPNVSVANILLNVLLCIAAAIVMLVTKSDYFVHKPSETTAPLTDNAHDVLALANKEHL